MFGFDLSHTRDPNSYSTSNHAWEKQTSTPTVQIGMITATDPINHTVDVKLLSIRGSDNLPMILYNIKVAIDRGGGGWGEHNLPWIGQQVEVVFESGNSLISTRCFVGRRFYTTSHKPPAHPIFTKDSSYQKGHFEMAEGGSYHFKKTDGTVTSFNAAPHSVEGSKTNARATGTAKTSSEALMDKSQEKTALAKQQLDAVASSTANVTDLAKQKAELAKVEGAKKAETQKPAPPRSPEPLVISLVIRNFRSLTELRTIENVCATFGTLMPSPGVLTEANFRAFSTSPYSGVEVKYTEFKLKLAYSEVSKVVDQLQPAINTAIGTPIFKVQFTDYTIRLLIREKNIDPVVPVGS